MLCKQCCVNSPSGKKNWHKLTTKQNRTYMLHTVHILYFSNLFSLWKSHLWWFPIHLVTILSPPVLVVFSVLQRYKTEYRLSHAHGFSILTFYCKFKLKIYIYFFTVYIYCKKYVVAKKYKNTLLSKRCLPWKWKIFLFVRRVTSFDSLLG